MLSFPISDLTGISLSPEDGNSLVLIHLHHANDLVLSLHSRNNEDYTGELVGVMADHFRKKLNRSLNVQVSLNSE